MIEGDPFTGMPINSGNGQSGNLFAGDPIHLPKIIAGQLDSGAENNADPGLPALPTIQEIFAGGFDQRSTPTTQPVINAARVPPNNAFSPIVAKRGLSSGSRLLIPPIWMATLAKLANPQRA